MARYALTFQTKTMVAVADTSNFTDNGYASFLQGGSSTMRLAVNEVYIGGEDTTSTPTTMVFARDTTVAASSISGNMNALLDASAVAPGTVAVFGCVSTTKPQRSSSAHLLQLSLNTYGGIARWQARYGEEITIVGNTQPLGEASLSSVTGTGKISGHIIYEQA
jgi:hypothetical protein